MVIDRRMYVARRFSLCFLHGGGAVPIFPVLLWLNCLGTGVGMGTRGWIDTTIGVACRCGARHIRDHERWL